MMRPKVALFWIISSIIAVIWISGNILLACYDGGYNETWRLLHVPVSLWIWRPSMAEMAMLVVIGGIAYGLLASVMLWALSKLRFPIPLIVFCYGVIAWVYCTLAPFIFLGMDNVGAGSWWGICHIWLIPLVRLIPVSPTTLANAYFLIGTSVVAGAVFGYVWALIIWGAHGLVRACMNTIRNAD